MTSNPLHAAHYADDAVQATVAVSENVPVARDIYRLRLECPSLARRILPGQFLMVRLAACDDPLIGRPFALYDTADGADGSPRDVDFVYLVGGKLTRQLAVLKSGQQLEVWGPLGNGFRPRPCRHLILVAGGIGQTPLLAVARERGGLRAYGAAMRATYPVERMTLCYGARSQDRLAGLEDFASAGVDLRIATDDGSRGHRGFVTDLLSDLLSEDPEGTHILCCGPEPMMAGVHRIASNFHVPCEVSLEEPMACGIGICFTCVARIRGADGSWDYQRTCVEGPVFPAERVIWEADPT